MDLNDRITKITILTGNGPDKIMVHTTLPSPYIPESGNTGPLLLQFDTSAGFGKQYVQENFSGHSVDTINLKT